MFHYIYCVRLYEKSLVGGVRYFIFSKCKIHHKRLKNTELDKQNGKLSSLVQVIFLLRIVFYYYQNLPWPLCSA